MPSHTPSRSSSPSWRLHLCLVILLPSLTQGHNHYEKFFYIQGGPEYMYYFATFEVGTPEKPQSVIIDTGSDTMAFPCETCKGHNCGSHQYPRFKPETSKSFKYKIRCSSPQRMGGHQVCKFVKSYAEGSSLYGFLADDLIRFKSAKQVYGTKLKDLNKKLVKDVRIQTEFGCTEKETGLFKTQYADGILGLDDQSEFINSLEQLNGNGQKVFSFGLCFHEHGGIMSIDLRKRFEPDDKIRMLNKDISEYQKPLIVPYDNSNMYFEIPLYGFSLGNDRINLDVPATMMIDSGTTFSHFPNIIMRQILRELNKWCSKSKDRCGKIPNAVFKEDSCLELRPPDENFKNDAELLATFPDFHLYLGQRRSYRLRPKNYFYNEYLEDPKEKKSGMTRLCMAIKGHNDDKIIMGAFSMVDHYFYFDRKSQKLKIFRENCFLRTKNLIKKERILMANPEDGEVGGSEHEEIEFSIPYKEHILAKGNDFEDKMGEDDHVGSESMDLAANVKKIKQRLLSGESGSHLYSHSILKNRHLASKSLPDFIPSRRLTSRRKRHKQKRRLKHAEPRELYMAEEKKLLKSEAKSIKKKKANEMKKVLKEEKRLKLAKDREYLRSIPAPSVNDKICFGLTLAIVLAIILILIKRKLIQIRGKNERSAELMAEGKEAGKDENEISPDLLEAGRSEYLENVVTIVDVKNEQSVLSGRDMEELKSEEGEERLSEMRGNLRESGLKEGRSEAATEAESELSVEDLESGNGSL